MQVIINMFVLAEGARGSPKSHLSAQCQRNRLPQFDTVLWMKFLLYLSFVIRRNASLTLDLTSAKTIPTYASNVCQLALENCALSAINPRHAVIYLQNLMRAGRDALMCSLDPLFFFFFFTKVRLFRRGQAAAISDTDNHVALPHFSQTPQCPYLYLTMSLCI